MSNSVQDFFKKIPGTKSELKDVDCSISFNVDIKEIRGIDVIVRSLYNLLMTKKGSYIFDPDYGASLYKYLFEQCDDITKEDMYQEIEAAIRKYENRAKISYDINFLKDKRGFIVDLYIEYNGEKKTVSIPVDESMLKTLDK